MKGGGGTCKAIQKYLANTKKEYFFEILQPWDMPAVSVLVDLLLLVLFEPNRPRCQIATTVKTFGNSVYALARDAVK